MTGNAIRLEAVDGLDPAQRVAVFGADAALFQPRCCRSHFRLRHPVDAASGVAAMIDAGSATGSGQRVVFGFGPCRAPFLKLFLAVPIPVLFRGPLAGGVELAQRQHDVCVNVLLAVAGFGAVNVHVRRHAPRDELPLYEVLDQLFILFVAEFTR